MDEEINVYIGFGEHGKLRRVLHIERLVEQSRDYIKSSGRALELENRNTLRETIANVRKVYYNERGSRRNMTVKLTETGRADSVEVLALVESMKKNPIISVKAIDHSNRIFVEVDEDGYRIKKVRLTNVVASIVGERQMTRTMRLDDGQSYDGPH